MSPEETNKCLRKMICYISQDAEERVNEIEVMAWEQAVIRKVKLVQTGRNEIDSSFEKFERVIILEDQRYLSKLVLARRINLENHRHRLLDSLFQATQLALVDQLSNDADFYEAIFSAILFQALLAVLSNNTMHIFVQESDYELIKKILPATKEMYRKKTGYRRVKIKVRRDFFLNSERDVKVSVTTKKQKVNCRISLMDRLSFAFQESIPYLKKSFLQ